MSYETVLLIVFIFSIPAFVLVVTRMFAIKRQEEAMETGLEQVMKHSD